MTADLVPVEDVERRLRAAFHAVIPTLADVESDADTEPAPILTAPHRSQTRWSRRVSALAVAASLAALAGVAVFQQRQEPAIPSDSALPTSVATTIPSATTEAPTAITAIADNNRVPTGWYLPTYVPLGYELISVAATLDDPIYSEQVPKWLRRASDGIAVNATLSLAAYPDSGEVTVTGTDTVHGQPAEVWDPGTGWAVIWSEAGVQAYLTSTGLERDELLAAAELVIVDPVAGAAEFSTLPPAFVPSDATPPEPNAVQLSLTFSPQDNATAGFITVSAGPNNRGETLETLLHQLPDWERVTLGGIERAVLARPPDSLGPFTSLSWVEGGTVFHVSGRAPYDQVMAFAESLAPSSLDAVTAAGESITTRALVMDTLDEATFDDGVRVVALQREGELLGFCVTEPVQRCRRIESAVAFGGEPRTGEATTFDIDGRRVLIAWHAGDVQPTLFPSTDPATASAFTQVITTANGVFVQVVLDADATAPSIHFGDTGFGVGQHHDTIFVLDY
jgi:hypothetical protein